MPSHASKISTLTRSHNTTTMVSFKRLEEPAPPRREWP